MKYSSEVVEAALCFWEAMLDARSEGYAPPWLEEYWWGEGTSAMRQRVIDLAPRVNELWKSLGPLQEDLEPFDWEFCPLVLSLMPDPVTLPTIAQIKQRLAEKD